MEELNRKYKKGDVVLINNKQHIVMADNGAFKSGNDPWIPMYTCFPLNKKGKPDMRCIKSLSYLRFRFSETIMTKL